MTMLGVRGQVVHVNNCYWCINLRQIKSKQASALFCSHLKEYYVKNLAPGCGGYQQKKCTCATCHVTDTSHMVKHLDK